MRVKEMNTAEDRHQLDCVAQAIALADERQLLSDDDCYVFARAAISALRSTRMPGDTLREMA